MFLFLDLYLILQINRLDVKMAEDRLDLPLHTVFLNSELLARAWPEIREQPRNLHKDSQNFLEVFFGKLN